MMNPDEILSPVKISLMVASTATITIAVVGLAVAYFLARSDFRGRNLIDALITVPMVLPPTVIGYYLVIVMGRKGWIGGAIYQLTGWTILFTWQGAALASFVVALPIMIRVSRAAIEGVDRNLIKASYSLGKSEWVTFCRIVLPLSRGGLLAGVTLSFARALGEFGATLMIAGNIPGKTGTLPLAIYSSFQTGDTGTASVLAILLTAVAAIIWVLNSPRFVPGR